jgi:5-methyltetrahydrofolate--homocysteine methyltransferase
MLTRFRNALATGRVILMDGAMGTELIRRGLDPQAERSHDWNESHPDDVLDIHEAYVAAGATCLLTNSFLAAREDTPSKSYVTSAQLARRAAGESRFTLLDLGAGGTIYTVLLAIERSGNPLFGCDAILIETEGEFSHIQSYLEILAFGRSPLLVSLCFQRLRGKLVTTEDRQSPEDIARYAQVRREDFLALGVNCGRDMGMDDIIEVVRRYRTVTDLPILARPNAGTPIRMGGRWVYPHSPSSMASRLPELIDAGATLIGGCCGTTPAHIAAFREVIDRLDVGWKP